MRRREQIIAWGAFAIGLVVGILASALNWFQWLFWMDEALHAYMSGAVALIVSVYLPRRLSLELPDHPWLQVFLVVCVALFVGLAWEIAEWLYDLYRNPNAIKGKWDTMVDFCFDAAGALVGAVAGRWLAPVNSRPPEQQRAVPGRI